MMKLSSVGLRQINDSVNAHLKDRLSLGTYEDIVNASLINLVMSKVDAETQMKWEETLDYTKLSKWSKILSRRCQVLEAREVKSGVFMFHLYTKDTKNIISKHISLWVA